MTLGGPPGSEVLRDFPRTQLDSGWRLHRREFPPEFYFRGPSRFTPGSVSGTGVLYLATTLVDALSEAVVPGTVVSSTFFDDRNLTEFDLSGIEFADLRSNHAMSFGMSVEITTSPDYTAAQEWASALAKVGFGGLVFPSRHLPAATLAAVFGEEGPGHRLNVIRQLGVTPDELHEVGITVVSGPSVSQLDLL